MPSNDLSDRARVKLRPEIERLIAYDAGPQAAAGSFQLAGNENPFEPLPAVVRALRMTPFSRYPDAAATRLRAALASRHNLPFDAVHVSAGSVSIIYELISAMAGPHDEVIMSWRSFEAYPKAVSVAGATSVLVANRADGSHDLPTMAAATTDLTRVILVCSPNNPTGSIVRHDDFVAFLDSVPSSVVVALDEAYVDYVRDSMAVRSGELLARYPNLIILRTFSKAYGLAGLRVGYVIGNPDILRGLRTASVPFAVTELAQAAALASLDSQAELTERVDSIVVLRDRLVRVLRSQGWAVPNAGGNFVWLPTGAFTAAAAEEFAQRRMLVRAFAPDGIRITVAEKESIEPIIEAAERVQKFMRGQSVGRLVAHLPLPDMYS